MNRNFSRRDFLKTAGTGLGAFFSLAFNPHKPSKYPLALPQFPAGEKLGRIAVTPNYYSTELKPTPSKDATAIRNLDQDEIIVWQREVIGSDAFYGLSRTWVDTGEGYVYAPHVQPVRNQPNNPVTAIPAGKQGFWAEVTVPYVDLQIQNAPISPGIKYILSLSQMPRLYYSQIVWIDQVGADGSGKIFYRYNESPGHGYGYGDVFLAEAEAFRPLTADEVAPINPDVDPATKRIEVNVTDQRQYLSCFEGDQEVYFCKISSGYNGADGKFSTPVGQQAVSWKIFSVHMAANTSSDSGYDTMGVSWPTFFNTSAGAAIHAAFWHNDFGNPRSHGCINAAPEDAKWIFRWTTPTVTFDQPEIRMEWPNVGTPVNVVKETVNY
jgi:hypothetical protein